MTAATALDELQLLAQQLSGSMQKTILPPNLAYHWLTRGSYQIAYRLLCLEGVSSTVTTAGTAAYTLPDDFLKVISVVYDDNMLTELDHALVSYVDTNQATPSNYVIQHPEAIRLYPIPDAIKNLYIHYYRRPATISADGDSIDLPEELAQLCVEYAVWRLYQTFQPELAPMMWETFQANFKMHEKTAERQVTSQIVSPKDDFFGGEWIEPRMAIIID